MTIQQLRQLSTAHVLFHVIGRTRTKVRLVSANRDDKGRVMVAIVNTNGTDGNRYRVKPRELDVAKS